jgi:hypothetical protein
MDFFFDPSQETSMPGGSVQEGPNTGVIVEADLCPNKAGTGQYVMVVVDFGPMAIKDYCNVEHVNPDAVKLGRGRLAAVYAAAGAAKGSIKTLIGKRVVCELKKAPGQNGKMYFEIDSWKPQGQAQPQRQQQPQPQRQQAPAYEDVPF